MANLLSFWNKSSHDPKRHKLSAHQLLSILKFLAEPVLVVNLNHEIILSNQTAEKLLLLEENELVGKRFGQVFKLEEQDQEIAEEILCPILTSADDGKVIFERINLRFILSNGAKKFVNLTVSYNAHLPGFIFNLRDTTQEKELENMKLDFVSIAAHELRTPLTSLKGYLYIFLDKYRERLNPEQRTFLTRMNISSQRLISLVENLLNVNRIEQGKMKIHLERVDWFKNVKTIVDELADQATDKQIEVELVTPDSKLAEVMVDKFRINEVLVNLLSNAIVYTPAGGKIRVWFEQSTSEVITHIQDNGPGIPQEALPHLFTKFFRVAGQLEQGSKGTGLGLYITKTIVTMHGGRIWVESLVGKGSIFSFALPIVQNTKEYDVEMETIK